MQEEEKLLQENANLAVISRLINSSLNKTVQETITSMFGELQENDAILVTKRIPLICERIANILKNQEEVKLSLSKKEDDYELRLRSIEAFKSQMDGKADKNSVWLAYIISGLAIASEIVLHFWK